MRVLDIATGTGLAADAALDAVGSEGHLTAADISTAMIEEARRRLQTRPNAAVAVEDGQALSFPDASFDAVLCNLGLMFFPEPARGLSQFYRVLRPRGYAAVSVNTVPERSFNSRVSAAIGRHVPALAEAAARLFSLGDPAVLRSLFKAAGFRDVETTTEMHRFALPCFDDYFEPYEQGAGSVGQALIALPQDVRRTVREEVRKELGNATGPLTIEVEIRFASGRRWQPEHETEASFRCVAAP